MTRDFAAYRKSTYQWEPGHELHLRITKSSLTSDFDYCPKQYEYKRLHRLPEHTTDAMWKGIHVHDAIEQFYVNVVALVGKAHSHLVAGKREEAMALFQQALPTEMAFYKHLLEVCDHEFQNITHWGWVYPSASHIDVPHENKFGIEQRSINMVKHEPVAGRRSTDYRKKIRRMTDALITSYLTENFQTKPSTGKCAWCSFKSICPSWDGSDDPEEYRKAWEEEE
jgi:hypothetical protein